MRKLFLMPVLFVGVACNAEQQLVDVMGTECAFVADDAHGASQLVKCPIVPELVAMQQETPNSMFFEGDFGETHISEYVKDKNFIWVNVVLGDCGENTTGYRIMVSNPVIDGQTMHAVSKCK